MNEIEKMYKNANVEKHLAYFECHRGRSTIGCPINRCEKDDKCISCINSSAMKDVYKYPPFTAEKKLKLIKLLATNRLIIDNTDNKFEFSMFDTITDFNSFEESLADLTNRAWQDLTSEEKQQIREILE